MSAEDDLFVVIGNVCRLYLTGRPMHVINHNADRGDLESDLVAAVLEWARQEYLP